MDIVQKYFRTHHLPWSEAVADDDVVAPSPFTPEDEVVVTIKMDGENFTGYPSGRCHARSVDSANHESRDYVKAFWRNKAHLLPHGWRVCGENLYAKHSIHYTNLKSYLYVFSIWNEENYCLSWDDMVEWAELLELTTVEVIYRGKYDEKAIKQAFLPHKAEHEGYVIRLASGFHYDEVSSCVAKCVRKDHVQTDVHWMHAAIVPNKLS